ncbi:MAG: hypothetical protein FWC97_05765 [Treponema sp.]|nr:hypothetical protein [Treponema sp.]
MSLSQNSVSFETGFRKSVINAAFSFKSKEAAPKTEVLGQSQIRGDIMTIKKLSWLVLVFAVLVFANCDSFGEDIETMRQRARGDNLPVITIEAQPTSLSVAEGNISGSLSVTARVTRGAELNFQWFNNTTNSNIGGTAIYGATSASFEIPSTLSEGTYFYFVEVTATGRAVPVLSGVATVWVTPPNHLFISTQPQPLTSFIVGDISGSLTVSANMTGWAELDFQWFRNTENSNENGTKIDGETNANFAIPQTLTAGVYYYFVEITSAGVTVPVRSAVAVVIVNEHIVSVSTGLSHTMAITANGDLFAWGNNGSGQLGDGTTIWRHSPVRVGTASNWASVSAGSEHTMATTVSGELWAWGLNNWGQLGDGTTTTRLSPVRMGIGSNWASVSAGGSHTMAIMSMELTEIMESGELFAWGWNGNGRLGDGTVTIRPSLVRIGTTSNWASVSAGNAHTVAIMESGELWAWGANWSGQLGNGWNEHHSPVRIGTASNWASVSAGQNHTVAITTSGELWAWGDNSSGQLGDGTTNISPIPVRIGTASNWASVSTGQNHTVAITTDGELWAWGWNLNGQLGDGTTTSRPSPVRIGTASNWASVSAGWTHTVAITTDGELWAWGNNGNGRLGDGTTIARHSPVRIRVTP